LRYVGGKPAASIQVCKVAQRPEFNGKVGRIGVGWRGDFSLDGYLSDATHSSRKGKTRDPKNAV
jgi:hypothetical protein